MLNDPSVAALDEESLRMMLMPSGGLLGSLSNDSACCVWSALGLTACWIPAFFTINRAPTTTMAATSPIMIHLNEAFFFFISAPFADRFARFADCDTEHLNDSLNGSRNI